MASGVPPGTSIGGYKVVRTLGAGTSGVVLEAEEPELGRRVAIKLLSGGVRATATQLLRFRREREALAQLRHPHVLRVHAAGSHQGTPYVVTELLPGRTLRDLMGDQALPVEVAAALALQVADGLGALHAAGLVHRDVKPENVLVAEDGQLKVADLGLAIGGEDLQLTETGSLLGTPEYMPPEALRGQLIRSPTADVYSLGVVFYELLTGELPHPASNLAALIYQRSKEPRMDPSRARPEVPAAMAAVCARAMGGLPEERYADARGFADELRRVRPGAPGSGRSAAWLRVTVALSVGLALLALGATLGTSPRTGEAPGPAAQPSPAPARPVEPASGAELVQSASAWSTRAEEARRLAAGQGPQGLDEARLEALEREPLCTWSTPPAARTAAIALEGGGAAWAQAPGLTWATPDGRQGAIALAGPPIGALRVGSVVFAIVEGELRRVRLDRSESEPFDAPLEDVRLMTAVGDRLLVAFGERGVALCAAGGPAPRLLVGQPGERVNAIAAAATGRGAALLSAPDDRAGLTAAVVCWRLGGDPEQTRPERRLLPAARTLAYSPQGLLAVGGSDGGVLVLRDVQTEPVGLPSVGAGERSPVRGLIWAPNAPLLYAAVDLRRIAPGTPGGIAVWDVERRTLLRTFGRGGYLGLDLAPDGATLVAARPGAVEVWSVAGDLARARRAASAQGTEQH